MVSLPLNVTDYKSVDAILEHTKKVSIDVTQAENIVNLTPSERVATSSTLMLYTLENCVGAKNQCFSRRGFQMSPRNRTTTWTPAMCHSLRRQQALHLSEFIMSWITPVSQRTWLRLSMLQYKWKNIWSEQTRYPTMPVSMVRACSQHSRIANPRMMRLSRVISNTKHG